MSSFFIPSSPPPHKCVADFSPSLNDFSPWLPSKPCKYCEECTKYIEANKLLFPELEGGSIELLKPFFDPDNPYIPLNYTSMAKIKRDREHIRDVLLNIRANMALNYSLLPFTSPPSPNPMFDVPQKPEPRVDTLTELLPRNYYKPSDREFLQKSTINIKVRKSRAALRRSQQKNNL